MEARGVMPPCRVDQLGPAPPAGATLLLAGGAHQRYALWSELLCGGKRGHAPGRFDQLGPMPPAGAAILLAVGASIRYDLWSELLCGGGHAPCRVAQLGPTPSTR